MDEATPPTARGIGVGGVVASALRHGDTVGAASGFARTVLKDFFWLQFSVKWGVNRIPIVHVDHPLDTSIPFAPERVGTYLDFIAFWIRPLGWIGRRFGADAQRRCTVEFLGLIERCYREAAGVYRVRLSTTDRPRYLRGRFLAIHLFDPHYLCVPSLHVMVVVLAWTYYRRALTELGATPDEVAALESELFSGSVEITEAVLFIKQHSVNCVPAALYARSRITPADVTDAEVGAFVDRLFADAGALGDDEAAGIRAFVGATYARLAAEGASDAAWPTTVLRLLEGLDDGYRDVQVERTTSTSMPTPKAATVQNAGRARALSRKSPKMSTMKAAPAKARK